MKRSMKKFLVTCAAVSAVSICAAASAMAADNDLGTATYTAENNSVAIVAPTDLDAGTQVTVLVNKQGSTEDADIYYINQGDNASEFRTMLLKDGIVEDVTYDVKLGGYKNGEFVIYSTTFKLAGEGGSHEVLIGDVDQNGSVTPGDASAILVYFASEEGIDEGTDAYIAAAKCDNNDSITPGDAAEILIYFAAEDHRYVGTKLTVND